MWAVPLLQIAVGVAAGSCCNAPPMEKLHGRAGLASRAALLHATVFVVVAVGAAVFASARVAEPCLFRLRTLA